MGTGANLVPWQQLWELLGCGTRDVPKHPCARARIWGEGAAFGVMAAQLCLQMELLARPLGSGKAAE